jgi:hypothetical protein
MQVAKMLIKNKDSFPGVSWEKLTVGCLIGSPSDGYSCELLDEKGNLAFSGVNHMDGTGWFLFLT